MKKNLKRLFVLLALTGMSYSNVQAEQKLEVDLKLKLEPVVHAYNSMQEKLTCVSVKDFTSRCQKFKQDKFFGKKVKGKYYLCLKQDVFNKRCRRNYAKKHPTTRRSKKQKKQAKAKAGKKEKKSYPAKEKKKTEKAEKKCYGPDSLVCSCSCECACTEPVRILKARLADTENKLKLAISELKKLKKEREKTKKNLKTMLHLFGDYYFKRNRK